MGLNIDGLAKEHGENYKQCCTGLAEHWGYHKDGMPTNLYKSKLLKLNKNSGQTGPSMGEDLNSLKTHFLFCSSYPYYFRNVF